MVRYRILFACTATMLALLQSPGVNATATSAKSDGSPTHASPTRDSLYAVLDTYLGALETHQPSRVPWAEGALSTENNVALQPGEGLWRTLTSLGDYDFRFADPQTGSVAFYGTVTETDTASPLALRLKIKDGRIAAAETVVARPLDAGVPFVNAKLPPRPELNGSLRPEERVPRDRLVAIANGYFDTLQRNDGTLHTVFSPDCNRREDGMQTTNHANSGYAHMELGCAAQFKLGIYRYDDALRARRFPVVDEERGLVLASAFIDHSGQLNHYTLADGRPAVSMFHRPHSYYLLEAFKIRAGKIEGIEAVFTTVPYGMPSPWPAEGK